jgi:predicted PolB exonuclease-like 3'-5' exonuclease
VIPPVRDTVWAFDAEWVPDVELGRRLYDLSPELPDAEVMEEMWRQAGGNEEEPRPFLKLAISRVVSIVALRRTAQSGRPKLRFLTLPEKPASGEPPAERSILRAFLNQAGQEKPQLVGYNSRGADLRIFIQRGIALGLGASRFARIDYLQFRNGLHVDLQAILSGFGRGTPSLNQLAVASGIPGKMDTHGGQVADLWLQGQYAEIVAYNQLDALTTYLLWLRTAYFAGAFTEEAYGREQRMVEELLEGKKEQGAHFARYLEAWRDLRSWRDGP